MELKSCIIAMIELFKVTVKKLRSSDNVFFYQTPLCNPTPKEMQQLLFVRVTHVLSKEP